MLKNLKDELNQIQQGVEQKQRELQQKINMPLPAQLREECAKSIVAAAINSLKDKIKSNGYIDYKKLLFKHYYYCGDCRVAIYVTADARQYKDFCYDNSVKYSTPPFYENSHGAECVPFIIPKNDFLQIRDSDSIGTYIQCRKKEDVFSIFERVKEIAKAEGFKAPRIKKRLILLNLRYTHAVTKMDDFYNLQNNRWPWFICIILGVLSDMAKEAVTNSVQLA